MLINFWQSSTNWIERTANRPTDGQMGGGAKYKKDYLTSNSHRIIQIITLNIFFVSDVKKYSWC